MIGCTFSGVVVDKAIDRWTKAIPAEKTEKPTNHGQRNDMA
jgi:hypothetical protein